MGSLEDRIEAEMDSRARLCRVLGLPAGAGWLEILTAAGALRREVRALRRQVQAGKPSRVQRGDFAALDRMAHQLEAVAARTQDRRARLGLAEDQNE